MDLASSSVQSMQLLFDVVCAASVLERTCNKVLYLSEIHRIWNKRSIITTLQLDAFSPPQRSLSVMAGEREKRKRAGDLMKS